MSKFPKESKADRETSKFCPAVTEALVGVNRRDPPVAAESGVTVRCKSKVMLPVELTVPSVTSTEAVSTLTALRVVVFKLEVPAVKVVAVVDRMQGGMEALRAKGYDTVSLLELDKTGKMHIAGNAAVG